jgi:hypothetical protein
MKEMNRPAVVLPLQIVVLLDAEETPPLAEILAQIPHERSDRTLVRYSDCGGPAIQRRGSQKTPIDWQGAAHAVAAMAEKVRGLRAAGSPSFVTYVSGCAPIPLFVFLGYALSAWAGPETLLNRRKDGAWDVVPLQPMRRLPRTKFFDVIHGLDSKQPSEASGRVAIFVSTIPASRGPREAGRMLAEEMGESVAGFVEISCQEQGIVEQRNGAIVAQELTTLLSQAHAAYPYARGSIVQIAGPVTLAYMVGRAMNPSIHPDVLLTNYRDREYEPAIRLPLEPRTAATRRAGTQATDKKCRNRMSDAIREISKTLVADDFAPFRNKEEARTLIERLRSLRITRKDESDAFRLSVLSHLLSFGDGLIRALQTLAPATQARVAELLLVHEVHHFDQNLQSTDYMEVGRAGVALEEVDFWADVFSLSVVVRRALREKGTSGDTMPSILHTYIDALIDGIGAFDRSEQGERIDRLAERRLRRYLIWHLQRARAATVRSMADMETLFAKRLIVEIAPIDGYLDRRGDKFVRRASRDAELFIVNDGQLTRLQKQPGLEPSQLVDAVRTFDANALRRAMEFVVGKAFASIAPWAARRI